MEAVLMNVRLGLLILRLDSSVLEFQRGETDGCV